MIGHWLRENGGTVVAAAAASVAALIVLKGPLDPRAIEVVIVLLVLGGASSVLIREANRKAREAALAHQQLVEAVETVGEGFVLFDAEGRLVVCNSRYRTAYPLLADLLVEGALFKDILRAAAERGGHAKSEAELASWVEKRATRHLTDGKPPVVLLSDGCWYRISEHPTPTGGTVKLLTDVTELKTLQPAAGEADR